MQTKQYALIGKTLGYSYSPLIHNTLFSAAGAAAEYGLLEWQPRELEAGMARVRAQFDGCNVTVPYKQAVIPYLDEITGEAAAVGAVNTICRQNGRLIGHNTDGEGFLRSLPAEMRALQGKRVLVCGAGGAARVIVYRLLKAGAQVEILNRTPENARALLQALAPHTAVRNARCISDAEGDYALCVNTTPVGMLELCGRSPIRAEQAARCAYVYDCIYNPAQTRLLQDAAIAGRTGQNGFDMLWHQAVCAQEVWGYSYSEAVLTAIHRNIYERIFFENKE